MYCSIWAAGQILALTQSMDEGLNTQEICRGATDVVCDASLESVRLPSPLLALTSTSTVDSVSKNYLCAFRFSSTAAAGKGHNLTPREMGHKLISPHLNVSRRLFSFVQSEPRGLKMKELKLKKSH